MERIAGESRGIFLLLFYYYKKSAILKEDAFEGVDYDDDDFGIVPGTHGSDRKTDWSVRAHECSIPVFG